jgi:UDP-glucose 4-epimerase
LSINKHALPITGTGDETRDFTYVGDIVNGLLSMAYYKEAIGEAFNLATGREIRIGNLAEWINEITDNKAGIVYAERRDWDKKNRLLASVKKAKKVLGYSPNMDFKEGLRNVNAWFTENWQNIQASYKS